MEHIQLSSGKSMPLLGLGVWQIPRQQTKQAVLWALEVGYRLIDTAHIYGNEREVGEAIRESGIPREEIFVTTKLWPAHFLRARAAFAESLEKLGLEYVDLYLIHWPTPGKGHAWRALEKIYEEGLSKSIGVSNYSVEQLSRLLRSCKIPPSVNQVEFSPFLYRKELLEFCKEKNIVLESYSPLTRGKKLQEKVLQDIALRYQKSSAQVLIRWNLQHGAVVIPKSASQEHIKENFDVFDFGIFKEDMTKLDSLNENFKSGW